MTTLRTTVGRKISAVLAVAALLIVGVFVLLSAPGKAATVTTAPNTARHALVSGTPLATDTPASTIVVTSTPTTPPTAQPTATQPAPTATPAPSWHVVANASGNGPASITTLHGIQGDVRVDFTCTIPDGVTYWNIGFGWTVNGQDKMGQGENCAAGTTSGSYTFQTGVFSTDPGADWTLSLVDSTDAGGPWTATVSVWY